MDLDADERTVVIAKLQEIADQYPADIFTNGGKTTDGIAGTAIRERMLAEIRYLQDQAKDDVCACSGTMWTEDKNWSPPYPELWRGERSPGEGLVPCGFCNEGGWDAPWPPADSPRG